MLVMNVLDCGTSLSYVVFYRQLTMTLWPCAHRCSRIIIFKEAYLNTWMALVRNRELRQVDIINI